jgi:hypothetical protein
MGQNRPGGNQEAASDYAISGPRGYNEAMATPPDTPEPNEARSRWSESVLVTLLVVLALTIAAGGYVWHEWTIVRERIATREWLEERGGKWLNGLSADPEPPADPSRLRRILGDFPDAAIIGLPKDFDLGDELRLRRVFPKSFMVATRDVY